MDMQICQTERLVPSVSHPSVVKLYGKFKDLMIEAYDNTDITMGGDVEGNIVEIDESLFGKVQKYRKGKPFRRQWVFGLVEQSTRKVYFEQVDNRTKATLVGIISKIVRAPATIYHDDWPAYRDLHNSGYNHQTVVHKREFKSKEGTCTNTVEGKFYQIYLLSEEQ